MSIFRLDCLFYYVSDLDRAVAFYATVFGFRLESVDDVARFDVEGLRFELVPTRDPLLLSGQGNARLTLAVDDIETAVQQLRATGVRVSDVRSASNGRLAAITDPDGNEIVVWQYA